MNRNMIFLNLALLGLVGALVFTVRERWQAAQEQQREVRERRIPPPLVIAPPAVPPVKGVTPAQYFDVADRTLFSKDRNPTIVVDAPPPPPPPPPMPELPYYHGEMAIGDPVVLLSTAKLPQRSYHVGETVGVFKLVRFDRDTIAFDWNGTTVERKLAELRPKEPESEQKAKGTAAAGPTEAEAKAAAARPSALQPAKASSGGVTTLGAASSGGDSSNTKDANAGGDSMLGPELSPTERACVAGENSPSGTVHSGYAKSSMITLLGVVCRWEKQ